MLFRTNLVFLWVLIFTGSVSFAYAEVHERIWEFDVQWPGTYQLLVESSASKDVPKNMNATYSIDLSGDKAQRSLPFLTNRMFIPISINIQTPQTVRVTIRDIPQSILQNTKASFLEKDSWLPGQHLESLRNRDFKELRQIREILEQPEDQIDLTHAKLLIDKMIDPSIDIKATQKQLNAMESDIKVMLKPNASSKEKVSALKAYLYQKGFWNFGRTYQYDFDDPRGTKISNKLISNYIDSRKGNCISMPFLFIILGDKLGIDTTASTAPLHVFVKYRDDATGTIYNLETTSGANPTQNASYRKQYSSITDLSLKNGIYLQKLTRKETAAAMATVLTEYYYEQKQFEKVIALCDLILKHYPKYAEVMIRKGSSYYQLLKQHFIQKYPDARKIPAHLRGHFQYLGWNNQRWFAEAEALGWREPDKNYEAKYLQRIRKAAKKSP